MKPTDYKSRAFLSIVSHKLSPNEIGDRLGIKYDDAIWKGAPNPFGKPQLHPFNLIIFRSRLSVSLSMDQHADDILSRLFPIWSKVKRLPKSCKASLTFCYHMRRSGGWSFNPSVMAALAKLDVPCVFTLDMAKKGRRQ